MRLEEIIFHHFLNNRTLTMLLRVSNFGWHHPYFVRSHMTD